MTRLLPALFLLAAACLELEPVAGHDPDPGEAPADSDGGATADDSLGFFVTSAGNRGGDFGGLVGADAYCQALAGAVGSTRAWAAYLSTAPIFDAPGALVHARDRIGAGPWRNAGGDLIATDVDDLHAAGFDVGLLIDERGDPVPASEHDILTGSNPDGTARAEFPGNPAAPAPTCLNWTSDRSDSYAWVGHSDADVAAGDVFGSSHETLCDEAGLASTAGTARLYCFAID